MCEKRTSDIALSYGVDVDKWPFDCFYVTMFVLNAKAKFSFKETPPTNHFRTDS